MKKTFWLAVLLIGVVGVSTFRLQQNTLAQETQYLQPQQATPEPYLKPYELLVDGSVAFDKCWVGHPNGMEPWI